MSRREGRGGKGEGGEARERRVMVTEQVVLLQGAMQQYNFTVGSHSILAVARNL